MKKLYGFLENLKRDERAQDMVEYALLAGLIAVAAKALLTEIEDGISTIFSKMASLINNAAAQWPNWGMHLIHRSSGWRNLLPPGNRAASLSGR